MKYQTFGGKAPFKVAVLIKSASMATDSSRKDLLRYYVEPLQELGVDPSEIICMSLKYDTYKKVSAATKNAHIKLVQADMDRLGCEQVLVCDANYLKTFIGRTKVTALAGQLLPSKLGSQRIFKGHNYVSFRFAPKTRDRLTLSLQALSESLRGVYSDKSILHTAYYPESLEDIEGALNSLLKYPVLGVDIEGYGLTLDQCGIGTIAFAINQHEGISFAVDYQVQGEVGPPNIPVRQLLLRFFEAYTGECWYHGISFDVKHLVFNLFMSNDISNRRAMVDGLETMTKNAYCTKNVCYLAGNSSEGNVLTLKHNALEFTGEYALDVKDITIHPIPDILEYNLIDSCATLWLRDTKLPVLTERKQDDVFKLFTASQRMLMQSELYGMPIDMDRVYEVHQELLDGINVANKAIFALPAITAYLTHKGKADWQAYQAKVKGEGRTLEDYLEWKPPAFKPSSGQQIAWILHNHYMLPVIDSTPTGAASTGGDTLAKHLARLEKGTDAYTFVSAIIDFGQLIKITDFTRAFVKYSIQHPDGSWTLHGNQNQGGTISGRLSSCLIGSSLIHTSNGYETLDSIKTGTSVPTHKGTQKVLHVFNNGLQPVFEITLTTGQTLTCTSNHRLLTTGGFKSMENIHETQTFVTNRNTECGTVVHIYAPQCDLIRDTCKRTWAKLSNSPYSPRITTARRNLKTEEAFQNTSTETPLSHSFTSRFGSLLQQCTYVCRTRWQRFQCQPIYRDNVHTRDFRSGSLPRVKFLKEKLPKIVTAATSSSTRLRRAILRWARVFNSTNPRMDGEERQADLRSSTCFATPSRAAHYAQWLRYPPYQSRQDRQFSGKSSFNDAGRTYILTSVRGEQQCSPIASVKYVGVQRVYDLEIDTDHCYIANGIYVHNSQPNLSNLPSKGVHGKAIKSCFRPSAPDQVMLSADFASLEAMIAALRTKDEAMLQVYTDGFDSHSRNTLAYAEGTEDWYKVIKANLDELDIKQKFYKVTHSDGTVEYVSERNLTKEHKL